MDTRVCSKCEIERPLEEFTLIKATGARKARCKKCEADRVRAYYNSNPEYRERVKATARLREDPIAWASHKRQKELDAAAPPPETRKCNRCDRELPLVAFNRHPNGRWGRMSVCRECKIAEGRDAKESGRWKSFSTESQRAYKLLKLYGITVDQYDALLSQQAGRCALCRTDDPGHFRGKFMVVDHDHKTGEVRGLLCTSCNVWLGNYEELVSRCGEDRLMRYLHPERYEPIDLSRVQVNAGIVRIS